MFKFNKTYFTLTLLILAIEILIALYIHDTIIRPYIGDVLVVILLYCFIRAFLRTPIPPTAIAVLLFSCLIETLQYFNIVDLLGWGESKVARIVIGSLFSWLDILSYIAGIAILLLAEKYALKKQLRTSPE
ncbi:DUF2809 domain-containing protein [Fulvivirgaceae bacterium PWU5]|uniref:DUF2809 domain-containing protein n=1 Tax=Dawidia cretensis TaxID=2782350 RepID=A0AAP2E0Y2_9BACT|nr:DUF2809 domain-containing protein [Dawidia cretensis]MBT1710740.1 DUF2809 domain-containing protein [Dawidia cretensis]